MSRGSRTSLIALTAGALVLGGIAVAVVDRGPDEAVNHAAPVSRTKVAIPAVVQREKTGSEAEREAAGKLELKRVGNALEVEKAPTADPDAGGEGENEILNGPSAQSVDQRAYPRGYVESSRASAARRAFTRLPSSLTRSNFRAGTSPTAIAQGAAVVAPWSAVGPTNPVVPGEVTYTGRGTTNSGRVTALAVDPNCAPTPGVCRLWVAAAGGGIWRTSNASSAVPLWESISAGLPTNSFGSLLVDPTDATGNTLYAGSGEPNGSSDSEAGQGLFKSTDGGMTWALVPGSYAIAHDRSIASIAVDPSDPATIWIGTALARHGSSSVNGGRRTPPGAPTLGVYRSTDGGSYFTLQLSRPPSSPDPADGADWFTGGASKLVWDPNDPKQLYTTLMGYGIFRLHNPHDGICGCDDGQWHQVYQSLFGDGSPLLAAVPPLPAPDPYGGRVEFDLADLGSSTRIYIGDSSDSFGTALLVTGDGIDALSDGALLAAEAPIATTGMVAPWNLRSDGDIAASISGFSSYNFCQNGQCGYDSFVVADPSNADVVWLGGAMAYDEVAAFGSTTPRSNGRAVVRSTNAGVSFTDMTNDVQDPNLGMHPDQHALVFNPNNTGQAFVGSDGGVVRTNGNFVDGNPSNSVCGARSFTATTAVQDLAFCQMVLASVPERIDSLNVGLNTLQFGSASLNSAQPYTDVIGGTQDNGTWAWDGDTNWFESVGGDGGNSGISNAAGTRMHTYFGPNLDVNFHGNDPMTWAFVSGPMTAAESAGESFSFYVPVIADPSVSGTYFMAGEYVWRTKDSGGSQAALEAKCLESNYIGPDSECGDFERVGPMLSSDGPSGADYIVAVARAASDTSTLWVGLRQGELFISKNIDAAAGSVTYTPVTAPNIPGRFVSGIAVDPKDPNHAWISYSGYSAYTPSTPGHVFEARYNPTSGAVTFTDRSYTLGDEPVTGIFLDGGNGDVYAATDFGVARLPSGAVAWADAAMGMPPVAVYGLTGASSSRVLYAATHGRGIYQLPLNPVSVITGPSTAGVSVPASFSSTGSAAYVSKALLWTLPNGSTSTAASVTWTPTATGSQTIKLKVTDSLGHSVTTTKVVTVAIVKPGIPGVPKVKPTTAVTATATIVPPSTGSGSAPTRYVVTATPGGRTCTAVVPAKSCVISGLTAGASFTYRAKAFNSAGSSNSSAATAPIKQVVKQAPVPTLTLPTRVKNVGTTFLLREPVKTNAGLRATVKVVGAAVLSTGSAVKGDVPGFRVVRASNGNLSVVVPGTVAMKITVTVTAAAKPGYTSYSYVKVYTTAKGG